MSIKVQEVFGQFAVEVNGKVELFATEAEARGVAVLAENEAEFLARAKEFTDALGLNEEGKEKTAKTKQNVVIEFLAYEAGQAETVADEVATTF